MERINVLRRGGAVVDVVRVLVHVQGDRRAATEAVGVIGGPLAHEPPTAGRVREQDPARAAVHRPAGASPHPPRVTPRIVRSSKAVMESAFVQRPTRPERNLVSRCSSRSLPLSQPWKWSPRATTRTACN